jgi:hypothetical protein
MIGDADVDIVENCMHTASLDVDAAIAKAFSSRG